MTDQELKILQKIIEEKRIEKGLTKTELAEKIGMHRTGLSRFLNGKTKHIAIDSINKAIKILNINIE